MIYEQIMINVLADFPDRIQFNVTMTTTFYASTLAKMVSRDDDIGLFPAHLNNVLEVNLHMTLLLNLCLMTNLKQ